MAENDEHEKRINAYKEKFGEVVQKLYANDYTEWEEVSKHVVRPSLIEKNKGTNPPQYKCSQEGLMVKDFGLEVDEIRDALRDFMIGAKKKLDIYRYEGDLYRWMRTYVNETIKILIKAKNPYIDIDIPFTKEKKKVRMFINNANNILDSIVSDHDTETTAKKETLYEALENAIDPFYHDNPKGAILLFLHWRDGLSFELICDMLGLPRDESNNLSKTSQRALEEILKIEEIKEIKKFLDEE